MPDIEYTDGLRRISNPSATDAGTNVGSLAGDPSALVDGDIWHNSATGRLRGREGGASVNLSATGAGNTLDAAYDQGGAGAGRTITVDTGPLQLNLGTVANVAFLSTEGAGNTGVFRVNDGQLVELGNAADLVVYSGDFITEVARIDGTAGNITLAGSLTFGGDVLLSRAGANILELGASDTLRMASGAAVTANGITGEIIPQTGAITPVHSASEGTPYWDTAADVLYCNSDGGTTWVQVGPGAAGGNDLDAAYDQGGAGAGRSITADSGAVAINVPAASANNALSLNFLDTSSSGIFTINVNGATTLVGDVVVSEYDYRTNVTAGANRVVGWSLVLPASSHANTQGIRINNAATAGQFISGSYGVATTLTGAVIGLQLSLANNVTAGSQNVTGISSVLPTTTGEHFFLDVEDQNDAATGPILRTFHNGISQANEDDVFTLQVDGESSTGVRRTYGTLRHTATSIANTVEDSRWELYAMTAGSAAAVAFTFFGNAALQFGADVTLSRAGADILELGASDTLRTAAGAIISANGITGEILIQTGAGAPAHAASEGVLYFDTTANDLYANTDGASTWAQMNGGGAGNTLDQAYDQGGAGAGRTVTVANGPVQLNLGTVANVAFLCTEGAGNTGVFRVNDGQLVELGNGTDLVVYSGNFVTEVARIDGATGDFSTEGSLTFGGDAILNRAAANTVGLGAGDSLRVLSATLQIRNPGDTQHYLIAGSAIASTRTATLPLLASDDTFVMEAFTQTLTNKTISSFTDDISADDVHVQVRNTSGSLIAKGLLVYISGFDVGSGLPTIALADADGTGTSPAAGWTNESIANNANGEMLNQGRLTGIDTSTFTAGDRLYMSSTPGVPTATRPSAATEDVQFVGEVLRSHVSLGEVEVGGAGRMNDIPNRMDDAVFRIHDDGDDTKLVQFQASAVATGTTRVLSVQNTDLTIAGIDVAQTWTAAQTIGSGGSFAPSGITGELIPQTGAITPVHGASEGTMYWDTVANLFYVNDDGATGWTQLGAAGAGNTLDAAYDEPTAGAGRTITVDSGAVQLNVPAAAGNGGLDIDFRDAGGGNILNIDVGAATVLTSGLDGINLDVSSNVTAGTEIVRGLDLRYPSGNNSLSNAIRIRGISRGNVLEIAADGATTPAGDVTGVHIELDSDITPGVHGYIGTQIEMPNNNSTGTFESRGIEIDGVAKGHGLVYFQNTARTPTGTCRAVFLDLDTNLTWGTNNTRAFMAEMGTTSGEHYSLYLQDHNAGATGVNWYSYHNAGTINQGNEDDIFLLEIAADTSASTDVVYGTLRHTITDVTDGAEDSRWELYAMTAGSAAAAAFTLTGASVLQWGADAQIARAGVDILELGASDTLRTAAGAIISANGITGEILIQTGAGAPAHSASEGVLYFDTTGDDLYANTDGASTWAQMNGAGAGNTLDAAYDQGGAGAGRTITTANGPVQLDLGTVANVTFLCTEGAGNTGVFRVNDGQLVELGNGTDLVVYSGDFATEVARIDGATGNISSVGQIILDGDVVLERTAANVLDLADGDILQINEAIIFATDNAAPDGTAAGIWREASDLHLNASTGNAINLEVNGVTEYQFDASQADFQANNVTNITTLDLNGTDSLGGVKRFDSDYVASGTLTSNSTDTNVIVQSRTHTAATPITDNQDVLTIQKTNVVNAGGATFASAGALLKLIHVATQTAGTLTDGTVLLELVHDSTAVGNAIELSVDAEANPRFALTQTGQMEWGAGSGAADVILSRSAANTLLLASGDTFSLDNLTGTGVIDFGGATSVEIPAVASPSLASGQVGIDTTQDTYQFHDGTATRALDPVRKVTIVVTDPTASEDIMIMRIDENPITVIKVVGVVVGTTPSVTIDPRHGTDRSAAGAQLLNVATAITSTTTGQELTTFTDATLAVNEFLWLETTAQSGTVTELAVTIFYRTDA